MKTLGERLKYAREKRNLKQNKVASILGVHNSTLAKYESNDRDPDTESLAKLADLYEVSLDWLSGLIDDPAPTPSFSVAGQEITLTPEEARVFIEMRKDPKFNVMFHDLATNPEKKVKMLLKMWETIKASLDEEDDVKRGDGFGDLED